jgi:hypothetical protein
MGKIFSSFELIFSKLRVREEEKDSVFGEVFGLLLVVEDNGGGKRNDDVAMGLLFVMIFVCCCLLRDVLGEIGGFRRVA